MLTKKQLEIFHIFQKKLFEEISWKEVKKLSGQKSSSIIQNSIKSFLEEGLITERRVGTSKFYKINIFNSKVFTYLELFNREMLPKHIVDSLIEFENDLSKHFSFYSIVVFGSYSDNQQTRNSDLDVAIFVDSESKKNIVEAVLRSFSLKSLIKIDGQIITKTEFLKMLSVDYENLGKQIVKKHLAFYNSGIFYSLLKKAVKNGFDF
jgi:predicted nucleotidyltransferase